MKPNRLLALAVVAVSLAVPQATTATMATAGNVNTPLLTITRESWDSFSPNADHHKDRTAIAFQLAKGASVTVSVKRITLQTRVVHREPLGALAAGPHSWHWDGKRHGKAVADGFYYVVFTVRRGADTEWINWGIRVDTDGTGRLVTSRPTVYPLSADVEDRIALTFVTREWYPDGGFDGAGRQTRTRLSILNSGRDVVWRGFRPAEYTPHFTWNGRDQSGNVLPPGDYLAVLKTWDWAGNMDKESVALEISHHQLEQRTWTTTIPAAEALSYTPSIGGCNGCEDFSPPVPSDRFPGGLSFRGDTMGYSAAHMTISLPFPAAPIDSSRVSASGGPTTPGSTDVGILYSSGGKLQTPVGDGATTTPWGPVRVDWAPFLPTGTQPVAWFFLADRSGSTGLTQSYDVATFTVEYRYYAPAG